MEVTFQNKFDWEKKRNLPNKQKQKKEKKRKINQTKQIQNIKKKKGDDAPRAVFPTVIGKPINKKLPQDFYYKDAYVGDEKRNLEFILSNRRWNHPKYRSNGKTK